jgi:hypothetical protein
LKLFQPSSFLGFENGLLHMMIKFVMGAIAVEIMVFILIVFLAMKMT